MWVGISVTLVLVTLPLALTTASVGILWVEGKRGFEFIGLTVERSVYIALLFMFLAMLILALYGIILPFLNLMLGVPLGFAPLWEEVPAGIWELLKWTAGVYAGGRTLEKVAAIVSRRTAFMGGAHRRPADGGRASPVNPPSDSV